MALSGLQPNDPGRWRIAIFNPEQKGLLYAHTFNGERSKCFHPPMTGLGHFSCSEEVDGRFQATPVNVTCPSTSSRVGSGHGRDEQPGVRPCGSHGRADHQDMPAYLQQLLLTDPHPRTRPPRAAILILHPARPVLVLLEPPNFSCQKPGFRMPGVRPCLSLNRILDQRAITWPCKQNSNNETSSQFFFQIYTWLLRAAANRLHSRVSSTVSYNRSSAYYLESPHSHKTRSSDTLRNVNSRAKKPSLTTNDRAGGLLSGRVAERSPTQAATTLDVA
ncbi:hypothetical protein J6590_010440 [Homalodisca vitripennis]|nr:hypothetical protein J6590_010440 [Homalodisca vitripennis]